MKKVMLVVSILFLLIISCKSKSVVVEKLIAKEINYIPYYLKVYEADSLFLIKDYKKSFEILDSLFKKFKPLNQESYKEYFLYLTSKLYLNDFNKIDFVLKKAIEDYGLKVENRVTESLFKIALKKSKFSESELNRFYDTYTKSLNLEYRYAIDNMIENDQRVRLAVPRNHEELENVDKENAVNIKLLIAKYGYPSIKKIGGYDFNNKRTSVGLLFLHATREAREDYILSLMLGALKKGECEPSDFATVYDKYLMSSGMYGDKVLYGELRNPKKSLDMLVVNPKKIDSIRKSIGLEHIEYQRWRFKKLTGLDINDQ